MFVVLKLMLTFMGWPAGGICPVYLALFMSRCDRYCCCCPEGRDAACRDMGGIVVPVALMPPPRVCDMCFELLGIVCRPAVTGFSDCCSFLALTRSTYGRPCFWPVLPAAAKRFPLMGLVLAAAVMTPLCLSMPG